MQILVNLVGNAIKYTMRGNIDVELSVIPGDEANRCKFKMTVSDTGVGISADKLDTIFEPFRQIDGSITRSYQGAGLGLAIVQRLVQLMDGTITVESEAGKGTTFTCTVECGIPDAKQAETPQYDEKLAHLPKKTFWRVLVAEDEETNALTARRMLEKSGHEVVIAVDGKTCIEELSAQNFDLILMDIQMPVMDGKEACTAIRGSTSLGDKAHIPIIALTAYAMAGDKERFLAAGMDDYIAKPFNFSDINSTIGRVMAAKNQEN